MVKKTTTVECNCETDTHLRIEELMCLEPLDVVVSPALEDDNTERELELRQVIRGNNDFYIFSFIK